MMIATSENLPKFIDENTTIHIEPIVFPQFSVDFNILDQSIIGKVYIEYQALTSMNCLLDELGVVC